jgi:hypothetical protein
VEPLNSIELLGIELYGYVTLCSNHIPERYINMPRRSSHRLGGGQHDRRVERIDELEPELLSQLARRRGSRMLIRLDVASG